MAVAPFVTEWLRRVCPPGAIVSGHSAIGSCVHWSISRPIAILRHGPRNPAGKARSRHLNGQALFLMAASPSQEKSYSPYSANPYNSSTDIEPNLFYFTLYLNKRLIIYGVRIYCMFSIRLQKILVIKVTAHRSNYYRCCVEKVKCYLTYFESPPLSESYRFLVVRSL